MDLDLSGRRAMVCGGSKGLGLASAQEIAALGADVTLVARNEQRLTTALESLGTKSDQRHQILVLDFADVENVKGKVSQQLQGEHYHILVNNTGGPAAGPIAGASIEALLQAFTQHVLIAQTLAQLLIPGMEREGYGRIINIISTSVKQPIKGLGVSNTIRGAMANWSKTLATEVAPKGITVNNLLPGATKTERLQEIADARAENLSTTADAVLEKMRSGIPMQRFGKPNEIGAVVAFLASPASAYITGTNVVVDGGRTQSL